MLKYHEARVLFDYDPVTSDELCLRVGESVEVRVVVGGEEEEEEEGWLYGSDLRGNHGKFPANYVADLRLPTNSPGSYGGGVPSAPSFHRPGGIEHAGSGGVSAATSVDGNTAVGGPNGWEGAMPATSGNSEHDSNRAPYCPGQGTPAPFGEQGRGNIGAATAINTVSDNMISQEQTTTQYAAASGAESEGAVSSQLPDGWLCAIDENSGGMYFFTADGQSSSWTRPIAAAAAATGPRDGGSGDRKEPDGLSSVGPTTASVSGP